MLIFTMYLEMGTVYYRYLEGALVCALYKAVLVELDNRLLVGYSKAHYVVRSTPLTYCKCNKQFPKQVGQTIVCVCGKIYIFIFQSCLIGLSHLIFSPVLFCLGESQPFSACGGHKNTSSLCQQQHLLTNLC